MFRPFRQQVSRHGERHLLGFDEIVEDDLEIETTGEFQSHQGLGFFHGHLLEDLNELLAGCGGGRDGDEVQNSRAPMGIAKVSAGLLPNLISLPRIPLRQLCQDVLAQVSALVIFLERPHKAPRLPALPINQLHGHDIQPRPSLRMRQTEPFPKAGSFAFRDSAAHQQRFVVRRPGEQRFHGSRLGVAGSFEGGSHPARWNRAVIIVRKNPGQKDARQNRAYRDHH